MISVTGDLSLDGCYQGFLGRGFGFQRFQDLLVDGVLGDDVRHNDSLGLLALTPEAGDTLLVEFQRPGEAEPDHGVAALLEVQAVAGRRRMDQADLQLPRIPATDRSRIPDLGIREAELVQPLPDAFQIMFVPVADQDGACSGFEDNPEDLFPGKKQ